MGVSSQTGVNISQTRVISQTEVNAFISQTGFIIVISETGVIPKLHSFTHFERYYKIEDRNLTVF